MTTTDESITSVLAGLDGARRAGWARAYAAERRVKELEAELAKAREAQEVADYYLDCYERLWGRSTVEAADLDRQLADARATIEHLRVDRNRAASLLGLTLGWLAAVTGETEPPVPRVLADRDVFKGEEPWTTSGDGSRIEPVSEYGRKLAHRYGAVPRRKADP